MGKKKEPTVSGRHADYVIEPCTFSLLRALGTYYKLDIIRGPWVCGGLVRRMRCHESLNGTDVDIAYPSGAEIPIEYMPYEVGISMKAEDMYFAEEIGDSLNVSMFTIEKALGHVVSVYDLLDPFTLTCCQFATDGRVIVYSRQGLYDAQQKVARLTPNQPYRGHKLIRKYRDIHGFELTQETSDYLISANEKEGVEGLT
jgi:hypothetical protein